MAGSEKSTQVTTTSEPAPLQKRATRKRGALTVVVAAAVVAATTTVVRGHSRFLVENPEIRLGVKAPVRGGNDGRTRPRQSNREWMDGDVPADIGGPVARDRLSVLIWDAVVACDPDPSPIYLVEIRSRGELAGLSVRTFRLDDLTLGSVEAEVEACVRSMLAEPLQAREWDTGWSRVEFVHHWREPAAVSAEDVESFAEFVEQTDDSL